MTWVRQLKWFVPLGLLISLSLQCHTVGPPTGTMDSWERPPNRKDSIPPPTGNLSTAALMRQVNLKNDMVRKGVYGRRSTRVMKPRYITIHSTQNYTADAERHALALKRGALRTGRGSGYIIWHFTVDDKMAIQHMPTSEQGIHADVNGPGNRGSIGIEMCEHRGNNRNATLDRTAKLTAVLMKKHGIPLRNVVPHYYWPRRGMSPPHKNCPHFLMDNGKPGRKWKTFVSRVDYHYKRLE